MFKSMCYAAVFSSLLPGFLSASPHHPDPHRESLDTTKSLQDRAVEAYIFGYPLVLMDVTRNVMTATPRPSEMSAPINQFGHKRAFPDPTNTTVVSPNADTLYSFAWLDLSKEPVLLTVPDTDERYYLIQLLDAWTNVFDSIGKRTTGTKDGVFAIVGPNWKGTLPADVTEIHAPTNTVWLIGRTQTNGVSDYEAVHAIQNEYKLTPLSAWGVDPALAAGDAPFDQSIDTKTPPVDQVAAMDGVTFFTRLANVLKNNSPAAADAAEVTDLKELGLIPGEAFAATALKPETLSALQAAVALANTKMSGEIQNLSTKLASNEWSIDYNLGDYGTDYLRRATVARVGLGANLAKDALYPMTRIDGLGQPLTGEKKYVMHFEKNQLPPVRAFWSLTMYDDRQFFVENPIHRYAIGDRDELRFNEGGSLDIYIQHDSPGAEKESNWLPAPKGPFNLIMRLYWPKLEALNQTWQPAPVVQVQ